MADVVGVAAKFVPCFAELVAAVLFGIVVDELFGKPSCDVRNGTCATDISQLAQGIDGSGEALVVVPLFLLDAKELGKLRLLFLADTFRPETHGPLRLESACVAAPWARPSLKMTWAFLP